MAILDWFVKRKEIIPNVTPSRLEIATVKEEKAFRGILVGEKKKITLEMSYDYQKLVQGLAYACIQFRALNTAKGEPIVYDAKYQTDNPELAEVHPFLDILYYPNNYETRQDLIISTVGMLDVMGNAFWYVEKGVNGKPFQIHLLRGTFEYITDNRGLPVALKQTSYTKSSGTNTYEYNLSDIIHYKYPDFITFGLFGTSIISRAEKILSLNHSLITYQDKFIKNDASGKWFVKSNDPQMNEEQAKQMVEDWKENYTSEDNAGNVIFGFGDYEVVPLNTTNKEMDYVHTLQANEQDILRMFQVPEVLLGTSESVNRSTATPQMLSFYHNTIQPILNIIDNKLTVYIRNTYNNKKLYVKSILPKPEDPDFELQQMTIGTSIGAITLNEYREWMKYNAIPELESIPANDSSKMLETLMTIRQISNQMQEIRQTTNSNTNDSNNNE